MATCLSKFPSVCLEAIFKHVPLSDVLYSVGLVCRSWYNLRDTDLKRRRRLVLLEDSYRNSLDHFRVSYSYGTELISRVRRDDGSPWLKLDSLDQFKFDLLLVPADLMQAIAFFSSLGKLCNITRLQLAYPYNCPDLIFNEIIKIIDRLAEGLFELNLTIHLPTNELAERLVVHLNRAPSLRHLKLYLDFTNLPTLPILSCLSHLTTFAISGHDNVSINDWIFASIKQHAQSVNSIDINTLVDTQAMLQQFDKQVAIKFNACAQLHIAFGNWRYPVLPQYNVMQQFCARFSSLTKLKLNLSASAMAVTMLARCLSLLQQLVHLDLHFFTIPKVEEAQPEEEHEELEAEIVQVPSVRQLILSFKTRSHNDTARLFVPEIFPNLQVLRLDDYFLECKVCEIGPRMGGFNGIESTEPELARQYVECTRLAREPFRRCANLHTIALAK